MRSFRKLNRNQLEQEESESEDVVYHEKKINLFELLEDENPVLEEDIAEEVELPAVPKKTKKKKKAKKNTKVNDEEDIDLIISEINQKFGKVDPVPTQKDFSDIWKLDVRNLDYTTEMKRKFGGAVEVKKTGRKKFIVAPRLSWPKDASLVSLELLRTKFFNADRDPLSDIKSYTLLHSKEYVSLQFQFYNAIETHDPNAIFYTLEQYPFHFSAQLQMSEVCKQNGDLDTSFEYIERCVYSFERTLGGSFKLDGKARLSYQRVENRPVFFALFKYIQFLSRKENDPVGCGLLFDFFAIKSENFEYYIEYYQRLHLDFELDNSPNSCFGLAICEWESNKNKEKSTQLLELAIAKFPSVVKGIYEKLEIYDPIINEPFFEEPSNIYLRFLILLHVENIYFNWKVPELQDWLKRTTKKVFEDYKAHGLKNYSSQIDSLHEFYSTRSALPLNCQRIIILSDALNFISYLPKGAMEKLLPFDPFPPEDGINGDYSAVYEAASNSVPPNTIIERIGGWIGRIGNSLFGQENE
ncbi:Transcription factor 25 [Boothiomyces sp. JEL0866]|nr:Transcription factor 25 [Boothiomyces sp. JEL0866]